uniref:ELM2 domain-containing protein n=1 Tax=Eptatretus burgeri TaxID=7764 RepID=A0A8C4PYN2_EPTBU
MTEPETMASSPAQRSKPPGALSPKSAFSPTACFVSLGEPVQCHTKFVTMKDPESPARCTATWHTPTLENDGVRHFSQRSTPSILGSPRCSRIMSPSHTRGWNDSLSDSDDESWLPRGRKKVLVGPRYQADIPDILTPDQEDEKLSCKSAALLWRFGCVSEADVEAYLREATAPSCLPLRHTSPVRDDERVSRVLTVVLFILPKRSFCKIC